MERIMTDSDPATITAAFIRGRRAMQASPATIAWYTYVLGAWARFAPPSPHEEDVEAWLASAPSRETARNWLRALRACYNWAQRRHGLHSPAAAVQPPRTSRRLPRVFTEAELRHIFAAATDPRDLAAVTVLLDTGIRIGELTSIRTEDVEINAITVTGKTGQRRAPISPATHHALMRIAPPAGPVFVGWPGRVLAPGRVDDILRSFSGLPLLGRHRGSAQLPRDAARRSTGDAHTPIAPNIAGRTIVVRTASARSGSP
jgi:integrase